MAHNYKNLFLKQSYSDCTALFEKILRQDHTTKTKSHRLPFWDYVILTASGEAQAEAYRSQLKKRIEEDRLPADVHYAVVPDPDGKRVGSGGATLNVLKYIKEQGESDLSKLRILVLHSGGDAKRTPQYSACGKIFSPVPRMLPTGHRSTLFDELLIATCGIPGRIKSGMLTCSGDVMLLFNHLQLDFYEEGAAAISIKEPAEIGKNHGVFVKSEDGHVEKFLHKQSVENLRENGATDSSDMVNIDTGAVIFSGKLVESLYSLADTETKFAEMVNEHVRLSFYADFLYPLAKAATLEAFYLEQPEGDFSPELREARTKIWNTLSRYNMKLVRFAPASFLHFGTTGEVLKLVTEEIDSYDHLGWSKRVNSNYHGDAFAVSNSYISTKANVGKNCYIEESYIHHNAVIGEGCVIAGVTVGCNRKSQFGDNPEAHAPAVIVPPHTVLHGLKLKDGRFVVRIYGVNDNPKEMRWLGHELDEALWTKPLFPVCDTMQEALEASLKAASSKKNVSNKKAASNEKTASNEKAENECSLVSLKDSTALADITQIIPWQEKLNDKIKVESLLEAIEQQVPVEEAIKVFDTGVTERIEKQLLEIAGGLDEQELEQFGRKIRIYYYLSKVMDEDNLSDLCFETIRNGLVGGAFSGEWNRKGLTIRKDEVVVKLPLRVNWGGGWSDTPPYCMEHGGTVLNAAITLNDEYPVEVTLRKIPERKYILSSTDIGSYGEFTDVSELMDCSDPMDVFALQKAALIVCGLVPNVESLGGGFSFNISVRNCPQGSGLGTSSILAGACVKAIFEFLGEPISEQDLYSRVLCMEQIMSTGGGWQDQVGGLTPGIKMITTKPSMDQKITCEHVSLSEACFKELNDRMAIIYTGQRRLARNLLREIIGKYIGNDPDVVEVLSEIQRVAIQMREALERGSVDAFAELLNVHWELSKKLDEGSTNTCIDQMFLTIDDLIDGRMICGAGGGGFIQVIMKKDVTRDMLQARLNEVFAGVGVEVWKAAIV